MKSATLTNLISGPDMKLAKNYFAMNLFFEWIANREQPKCPINAISDNSSEYFSLYLELDRDELKECRDYINNNTPKE